MHGQKNIKLMPVLCQCVVTFEFLTSGKCGQQTMTHVPIRTDSPLHNINDNRTALYA